MKLLRVITLLVLISLFVTTVSAHPGRTDSRGGHYNSSTGEYHYHHGYPAHSHRDIDGDGVDDCPYDFNDKTDHHESRNNSNSSSNTTTSSKPSTEKNSSSEATAPKATFWEILFSILGSVVEAMAIGIGTSYVLSWILVAIWGDEKGCSASIIFFFIIAIIVLCSRIYQIFK